MDYQSVLNTIEVAIQPSIGEGVLASYIPELATVDPYQFGMAIATVDGESFSVGCADERFSIQSISETVYLSVSDKFEGEKLWGRVSKEPSGNAFNSLVQLEYENGIPRNPFVCRGTGHHRYHHGAFSRCKIGGA